ncbi:hypothetical protein PR202_gb19736 [Eleusine coracana subsp. coracana]|uniref:Uncharacterized protein n=1 Tax=Eleusine coracana subsp. coracana TaxID=191504 RepID=A0AAV5F911_ELECO|nr:hypothetical protein PR202_gb19736 [Eleusine coracana subsp. coracana]
MFPATVECNQPHIDVYLLVGYLAVEYELTYALFIGLGSRPETSDYPQSSERHLTAGSSFSSASPFSESSQLASSSKQAALYLPRNHIARRSFMSKPVYPLVFRNPVSETEASRMPEASNAGRATPSDDSQASPLWRRSLASPELKFHNALSELGRWRLRLNLTQVQEEKGSDGAMLAAMMLDTMEIPLTFQIISVLIHKDCLEESTPKTEAHEPPCPLCMRAADDEGCVSFSEPLHVALRSARRNLSLGESAGGSGSAYPPPRNHGLKRNHSALVPRRSGGSLFRNSLKRRFPFKGRIGKELFGGRIFSKVGSSSSAGQQDDGQH